MLRNNPAEGGEDVTRRLSSVLSCNFDNMSSYLDHEQRNNIGFPRNSALWRWCRTLNCWSPRFLSLFCRLFPVLTVKIVRLLVGLSQEILRRELASRVLLLVRDPRATFTSRTGVSWCQQEQCQNITVLCSDLAQAYYSYQQLSATFGEDRITHIRFNSPLCFRLSDETVFRYEDLVDDPEKMSRWLFEWSGLKWSDSVARFISTHTTR